MGKPKFVIEFRPTATADLDKLRAFERRRIQDATLSQLSDEPFRLSRNRKELPDVKPAFEHAAPVWELRVGEFRVFYDGQPKEGIVFVRAIRRKSGGKTTAEIVK